MGWVMTNKPFRLGLWGFILAGLVSGGCATTITAADIAPAAIKAVAYANPLGSNWNVDHQKVAANEVQITLRMRHFHAGGDGEARLIFEHRAVQLVRDGGYAGYQIVSYTERQEASLIPASQRVAEGVIRLVGKDAGS